MFGLIIFIPQYIIPIQNILIYNAKDFQSYGVTVVLSTWDGSVWCMGLLYYNTSPRPHLCVCIELDLSSFMMFLRWNWSEVLKFIQSERIRHFHYTFCSLFFTLILMSENCFIDWLINCMEQSPSWEANSHSSWQEIPPFCMEPEGSLLWAHH
jgi:hypothetical protein